MKKLLKALTHTLYTIEVGIGAWFILSWINVICNNTMPYGELASWNLFTIIFG